MEVSMKKFVFVVAMVLIELVLDELRAHKSSEGERSGWRPGAAQRAALYPV